MAARDVFAALHRDGIPFVLIGGAALTAYGSPRVSLDTDLAIKSIDVDRAVELGYRMGLALVTGVDAQGRARVVTRLESALALAGGSKQGFVKLLSPDMELDLVYDNPVPFMRLWTAALVLDLEGLEIRVASLEHLKIMKQLSAASRDDEEKAALDRLDLAFIERKLRQQKAAGRGR